VKTLANLKCKSCGEIIPVDSNDAIVTCPSCGNVYDVPLDEKKEQFLNLYSRADDAWDHKDFEEAAELYQQILNHDNTQSEAHFGLVLCKYGITYEIDPITQKKMPTCNRINRDSILDDKHFQAALKYASKEAAASFQKRAQQIDRISRGFLKIVDQEPPYDVFISYKRTASDGSLTQDSKVARKLYFHLKEKGFKIFFADIIL
jgi:predicted  nucleic acid-binding Zn-ribbon protein